MSQHLTGVFLSQRSRTIGLLQTNKPCFFFKESFWRMKEKKKKKKDGSDNNFQCSYM